jgi:hypothetical protein
VLIPEILFVGEWPRLPPYRALPSLEALP